MHERKALMASLADAFVALPGGFGTLDELVEIITWRQLDLHAKPIGLLDAAGFWEPFTALVEHLRRPGSCASTRARSCSTTTPRDSLRRVASDVGRTLDEPVPRPVGMEAGTRRAGGRARRPRRRGRAAAGRPPTRSPPSPRPSPRSRRPLALLGECTLAPAMAAALQRRTPIWRWSGSMRTAT